MLSSISLAILLMLFGRRINKGYTAMVYSVLQESNASTDGSVE
jgi:hypothetical protein